MSDPIRELEIAEAQLASLRTQLATKAELYESQRQILHTVAVERDALTREVAGLRYYIAQLERNVTQEERAYAAGIASLLLSQQEMQQGSPTYDPAADLNARGGQRLNDPRQPRE